jgi:hypothetical protein
MAPVGEGPRVARLGVLMTTKDIRTSHAHVSCDVCGRTLLRGERSETYLAGGARREVCELCTPRAIHEGWVREGAELERGTRSPSGDRRGSFLSRLRRPREEAGTSSDNGWHEPAPSRNAPSSRSAHARSGNGSGPPEPPRELRQVRAVPTGVEQRTAAAVERFNASEHPRTIAGVARSLGRPAVVARPLEEHGSVVTIVVAWELCWYRYEIDLSDDGTSVRAAGQGYELDELDPEDRVDANAIADEYGALEPA